LPSVTGFAYIHSFARLTIFSGHPLCVHLTPHGSTDRRNVSLSRPQNHSYVYYSHGMSSHVYTPRFLYYYEFDPRSCTSWLVQLLPQVLPPARNRPRIAFRYTRATWMRLDMACNLKLIPIPLSTYSHVIPFPLYIYNFFITWVRTPSHEVNHYYICFIPPIYNSSVPSIF